MFIALIIALVAYVGYRFIVELKKDKKDFASQSLHKKISVVLDIVNEAAFDGKGKVTILDDRSLNLYQEGQNQIINFFYSTGHLTVTWKYKYYQEELVYKKQFEDVRNISIYKQEQIGEMLKNEMFRKIAVHKKEVLSGANTERATESVSNLYSKDKPISILEKLTISDFILKMDFKDCVRVVQYEKGDTPFLRFNTKYGYHIDISFSKEASVISDNHFETGDALEDSLLDEFYRIAWCDHEKPNEDFDWRVVSKHEGTFSSARPTNSTIDHTLFIEGISEIKSRPEYAKSKLEQAIKYNPYSAKASLVLINHYMLTKQVSKTEKLISKLYIDILNGKIQFTSDEEKIYTALIHDYNINNRNLPPVNRHYGKAVVKEPPIIYFTKMTWVFDAQVPSKVFEFVDENGDIIRIIRHVSFEVSSIILMDCLQTIGEIVKELNHRVFYLPDFPGFCITVDNEIAISGWEKEMFVMYQIEEEAKRKAQIRYAKQ